MNQQAANDASKNAQQYCTSSTYITRKQILKTWQSFMAHLHMMRANSKETDYKLTMNREQTYLQPPKKE